MMPILNVGFRWRRMLHGPFIFVETAAFRKLGGFNHEVFAGEDWELSRRLKKLAKETGKRLVILHRHPVMTSARRIKHYTVLTAFSTLYHIIFDPHCFTTSRQAARWLYDGRR